MEITADTPGPQPSIRGFALAAGLVLILVGLSWWAFSEDTSPTRTEAGVRVDAAGAYNPVTAGELNIEDGQEVDVGNSRGSFRALVRTFEGAMPGLLNVPIGFSPQSVSRYAGTDIADFFCVIGRDRDPVSGLASLSSTPLWVRPA